jgi:hypothetical protein
MSLNKLIEVCATKQEEGERACMTYACLCQRDLGNLKFEIAPADLIQSLFWGACEAGATTISLLPLFKEPTYLFLLLLLLLQVSTAFQYKISFFLHRKKPSPRPTGCGRGKRNSTILFSPFFLERQ